MLLTRVLSSRLLHEAETIITETIKRYFKTLFILFLIYIIDSFIVPRTHTYTSAYTIQLAKIQIFSHIHQTFRRKIKKKVFFLHKKPKNRPSGKKNHE